MSATAQVLDTIELLETILLDLPIGDALRAEQVCKLWHATIAGSIKLQRALFLRPTLASFSHHSDKLGRNISFISLSTPCYQVLLDTNTYKTLIPRIIDIESCSVAAQQTEPLISHFVVNPNFNNTKSLEQNILLTQPALESVTFFSNYTSKITGHPGDNQLYFHEDDDDTSSLDSATSEPLRFSQGMKYTHGKQFGLGAIRLQRPGGVTVHDLIAAIQLERRRFEQADVKGEWVKMTLVGSINQTLQTAVQFWKDVQSAQEMKRTRIAMSDERVDAA
ncbi:hypothetical protein CBER1_03264 [Cercospora berteroae]|uniref:F-box domain-containing protein n=1 Tax=Cercospora berteroae TaxID=357750 RepID=A0A2S6C2D4_9PEZI|nr:hypothetical protein CBER1_03264 [Cercospora berteroae]